MTAVIDLAARAVVLLLAASMIALTLRRQSAAIRAGVWTAALAGLLALPVAAVLTPAWRVPIWTGVKPASAPAVSVSLEQGSVASTAAPVPALNVARAKPAAEVFQETPRSESAASRIDWSTMMLIALAAVTLLLISRVISSHRRLALVIRSASPAGAEWSALVDDLSVALGLRTPVPVRMTDAMNVPAVAGVWKPVLLLPVEAREWTPDVRQAVVLHELAHVARRDPLSQLISQVTCALYWCVPFVWMGARRAAVLRERASDDVVLGAGIRASSYAENLIALARSASAPMSPAAVAMAQPSRIRERVEAILNPAVRRGRVPRLAMVVTGVLVLVGTAALGAIEPTTVTWTIATPAAVEPVTLGTSMPIESPRHARTLVDSTTLAAPAPPADAPVAQQSDRLCGGVGLDKSSSSIQENNDVRRWTVRLSGNGCSVDLRAEGKFEFTPDFTDLKSISSNGFFRVDVTDRGVRRQLEIESRGGTLERTWRVDGRERPYDAEAKAWFASFLIELDRRTAIGVDTRLPHLVRQGGVDAVLKETAQMSSDYARNQYYEKLPTATKVSSAEAVRVLTQASSLTKSDYYLAQLVETYGRPPVQQDATTRKALIQLVDSIESDYYRSNSIEHILGTGAPTDADIDVMLGVLKRMTSDHYKAEVMKKVLRADKLDTSQQAAVASAVATVGSDYYAAEVLKTLAQKGLRDDAVRRAYFAAVGKIASDHYQGEVLGALLSSSSLTERDLLEAVSTTKEIRSDYNRGQALERIARHTAATDKVRTAVLDAASGLSKYYAEQVRRAVGK